MKRIVAIVIAIMVIVFFSWKWYQTDQERQRYKSNFEAEKLYRSQERLINGKELTEMYDINEKLQVKLGIKDKQIAQLMGAPIKYRDTGRVEVRIRPGDTVKVYPDSIHSFFERPCYDLNILLYKGQFYESMYYHDSLYPVIYRKRPHKFLFIKYGKWTHHGAIYSSCTDSVYSVFENIRVKDR